jgi:hypothetical protein
MVPRNRTYAACLIIRSSTDGSEPNSVGTPEMRSRTLSRRRSGKNIAKLAKQSCMLAYSVPCATNLIGTVRLVAQFLPHLLTKEVASIVNVSSELAFAPLPIAPIYCAAKAGVHSFTESLRVQLKNTRVRVCEGVRRVLSFIPFALGSSPRRPGFAPRTLRSLPHSVHEFQTRRCSPPDASISARWHVSGLWPRGSGCRQSVP